MAGTKASKIEKQKPVGDLLVKALLTDGAHHKTWYVERSLEALGFDLHELRDELAKEGYHWEPGTAP